MYLLDTRPDGAMDLTDTQHMPFAFAQNAGFSAEARGCVFYFERASSAQGSQNSGSEACYFGKKEKQQSE